MYSLVIRVVYLGISFLAITAANAQPPKQTERVITGLGNLSILSKEASKEAFVKDEGLKRVLISNSLNCLIICQAAVAPNDGGRSTVEYYILFANARRTKFDKRSISKEDYDTLIKLADKVHID
jgi:hypothetical protein